MFDETRDKYFADTAGGLIGAMVGAGIPEERAKLYDEGVRKAAS